MGTGATGLFATLKSRFLFYVDSTNQHGVHSPFVYDLITKCFYDRKKKPHYSDIKKLQRDPSVAVSLKNAKLLHRIIAYLQIHKLYLATQTDTATRSILSMHPHCTVSDTGLDQARWDMIWIDLTTSIPTDTHKEQLLDQLHNDTVMVCHGIRTSDACHDFWQKFIASHRITVSIDTYDMGCLFVRKEQVKQDFFIRV